MSGQEAGEMVQWLGVLTALSALDLARSWLCFAAPTWKSRVTGSGADLPPPLASAGP